MEEKVLNSQEVGAKFFRRTSGQWRAYTKMSDLAKRDGAIVKIDHVLVIQDRTQHPGRTIQGVGNNIIGAMLFGIPGLLVSAASNRSKFDVSFDIYLKDGRVVEIDTQDEKLIRKLNKYVVRLNPRERR